MTPNYYQVLEVPTDAALIDIKKAYRRLALQHHPDRNNGSQQSTEKFKLVNEAYSVLSDANRRAEYDDSLKYSSKTSISGHDVVSGRAPPFRRYNQYHYVDPFAQFDDLFRNDPFFHQAFRDMDDAFAQRFKDTDANNRRAAEASQRKKKEGWIPWLLRQCGVDFQMTTYRSTGDGGFAASSYNTQRNTYTDKKTKTFLDQQGRRVTVQSMEKDGNRIEETYIDQNLVERKVNGTVEVGPVNKITTK